MALDQSFIGRTYPASARYDVGVEKIREFADAIGDPNPVYRDAEAAGKAGHPSVIAPPTFAMIVSMRAIDVIVADPELGLDWSRVVHGEQTFSYHRPIMAGDSLVLTATVQNVMSRAGNDFLTVRTDVATEAGEQVCVGTSTLVARGTA